VTARPPFPPFTLETAREKEQAAENAPGSAATDSVTQTTQDQVSTSAADSASLCVSATGGCRTPARAASRTGCSS
jgi:nuclear transport factor 2 (NTF2) superfamily protein